MSIFLRMVGAALIAGILALALRQQGRDLSLLLTVTVCCMVLAAAVTYLESVMDFVRQLQSVGNLNGELMNTMLKAVGIGLIAELAGLICADSGSGALGKAIEILAAAAILWLGIPLMRSLLALVEQVMGEV